MPKSSASDAAKASAQNSIAQTGHKHSGAGPQKSIQDVLLILPLEILNTAGVEQVLGGLHRLLPVEKIKLHLMSTWQKENDKTDAVEFTPMTNRIHACLGKYEFNIVSERAIEAKPGFLNQCVSELQQANYDLIILCVPDAAEHPEFQAMRSHFINHITTHVPSSVLVWRKPFSEQPHPLKVMLGTDASESSMTAAAKMPDLLQLKFANLLVVTVLSPIFQDNAVVAPFVNPEVLEQALDANAKIVFEMTSGILGTHNLAKPTYQKLLGSPATEIAYLAETENPDVIVVGSHNRKGFLAWLLGSVSSQLLHWDKHNLLVVR